MSSLVVEYKGLNASQDYTLEMHYTQNNSSFLAPQGYGLSCDSNYATFSSALTVGGRGFVPFSV